MKLAKLGFGAVLSASLLAVAAPAAALDDKARNTLFGAAIGAVAGHALGGDATSTILGAAAGGVIGNVVTDDRDHRGWKRGHRHARGHDRHGDRRYREVRHRGHHH